MSSSLVIVCGAGFPPKKLSFSTFFQIKFWIFLKKIKQNALDIIGVRLKDKLITIYIVPQLKYFLDFSRGVTPFCQNTVRKNQTKVGIAFVVNLCSA